jgi:hypothetical protein
MKNMCDFCRDSKSKKIVQGFNKGSSLTYISQDVGLPASKVFSLLQKELANNHEPADRKKYKWSYHQRKKLSLSLKKMWARKREEKAAATV